MAKQRYCPDCDRTIDDDRPICALCGAETVYLGEEAAPPSQEKAPTWIYYLAIGFILVAAYAAYLQYTVTGFEMTIRQVENSNRDLQFRLRDLQNAARIEKKSLEETIDLLKQKIASLEKVTGEDKERSANDAIAKVEQERAYWQSELDRATKYFQLRFKTTLTPPPPSRR
ncbi:MAG: hypothetical protein WC712_12180 [Candidatus Brocadiia bacterium]